MSIVSPVSIRSILIASKLHQIINLQTGVRTGWFLIAITGLLLFILIRGNFNRLTQANREVVDSYEQTIYGWIQVMDLRHQETKNHTMRVTRMTSELARLMGLTDTDSLQQIKRGAMLHDIGKIGIPDSNLIKPDKLDPVEWGEMKKHGEIGRSIDIPWCHHEKWDGSGYPRGIAQEAIPISARIFAVIDVWDALSHPRVYKPVWPEKEVMDYIREQAGLHFDPSCVKTFLENYSYLKEQGQLAGQ